MYPVPDQHLEHFFIAGINYKKSNAHIRGQFSIDQQQYLSILQNAPSFGIKELFVISTCNRTEIYGITKQPDDLINLLCSQTTGSISTFTTLAYCKKGHSALQHLFQVAAGLDSQILGDYEIVGQLKQAVKFSKEQGGIGSFVERLVNSVLQASKAIKNNTQISGGTVSVSFAAIQYLRNSVSQIATKKILIIGMGKIGRNTCKNLVDYLPTTHITLINRTPEKAIQTAAALGLRQAPLQNLKQEVLDADVVLVATNANQPIIFQTHLHPTKSQVFIDLSIPNNVDQGIQKLPNITLVNVDDLSKLKDETLRLRKAEVPKAKAIIAKHIQEFTTWYMQRSHVPVLKAVKQKLTDITQCGLLDFKSKTSSEFQTNNSVQNTTAIQKVVNTMAVKLQTQNKKGCHFIEAINEYIAIGHNANN